MYDTVDDEQQKIYVSHIFHDLQDISRYFQKENEND